MLLHVIPSPLLRARLRRAALYSSLGCVLAFSACSSSEPEPLPSATPAAITLPKKTLEKLSSFELDNHARIIVEENHTAPVVSVQAWVKAGSADEAKPGVAQLTQRLLLRGTKNHPGDSASKQIATVGGELRSYTTLDNTVISATLASRFVDLAADLVSDILLGPAFDDAEVKRELASMRAENFARSQRATTLVSELLFATAFTKHPYRQRQTDADLAKLTRDDVVQHFNRLFRGANLTVIVSGDVQAQEARNRLAQAIKTLPPGTPTPARVAESEPTTPLHATSTYQGEQAHIALGWRIPALDHVDSFALDLLAVVLGQGEASRLQANLVRSNQVSDAYSFAFSGRDPGLFTIGFSAAPAKIDRSVQEAFEQVATLRSEVLSSSELARAKKIVIAEEFYQRETISGGARKLGFFASVLGDPAYADRYLQKLAAVTAEDLRIVANRYLTAERLTAVVVAPKASEPKSSAVINVAQVTEQKLAKLAPNIDAKTGPLGVARITLPSGTTVLVQEDHRLPLVAVRAVFPGGLRYENSRNNGINTLLATMITRGTKQRRPEQMAKELEDLGAKIEGFSGHNVFGVRAELTKAAFEPAFELVGEMLINPSFEADELERERPEVLADIRAREDNGSTLAVDLFTETMFDNSPLRLRPNGTVESVSTIKADDLTAYYAKHYSRDRLVIAIVGDVTVGEVSKQAERLFGRVATRTDLLSPIVDGPLLQARHVERARDRGAANALVGVRGLPSRHADRPALELLGTVLTRPGGRLTKLMDQASTDKATLAQRVDGVFIDAPEGGYLASFLSTTPDKLGVAMEATKQQWQRLGKEQIGQSELDEARRYLIGTRARRVETIGGRASALALGEAYGLGYDFDARFEEKVATLTPADLMRVAQVAFADQQLVSVAVRPVK